MTVIPSVFGPFMKRFKYTRSSAVTEVLDDLFWKFSLHIYRKQSSQTVTCCVKKVAFLFVLLLCLFELFQGVYEMWVSVFRTHQDMIITSQIFLNFILISHICTPVGQHHFLLRDWKILCVPDLLTVRPSENLFPPTLCLFHLHVFLGQFG